MLLPPFYRHVAMHDAVKNGVVERIKLSGRVSPYLQPLLIGIEPNT